MKQTFKKSLFKTLLTSVVVLSTSNTFFALAQNYEELVNSTPNGINNLNSEQTQLYAQLVNSYNQIDTLKTEAKTLQEAINKDDETIKTLNAEIKTLEEVIEKREQLIADQAVAIQENGGTGNYVNAVASADSISDFVGRVDVIRKLVSSNKDLLAAQKEDIKAVETKIKETEDAKAKKIENMVELESLKGDLVVSTQQAETAFTSLTQDASLEKEQVDAIVEEVQVLEANTEDIAVIEEVATEINEPVQVAPTETSVEAVAPEATVSTEVAQDQTTTIEEANVLPAMTEMTLAPEAVAEETTVQAVPVVEEVATTVVAEEVVTTVAEEVTTTAEWVETTEAPIVEETTVEEVAPVEEVAATPDLSYNTGSLIGNAEKYLGTPYVWGGKSPSGFDCSGFVQYVFRETYGTDIGGWTVAQESAGTHISVAEAQVGDLYFWGTPGGTYHVAIATGGGSYIHASQPGSPLGYNNISNFTPDFAVRVN